MPRFPYVLLYFQIFISIEHVGPILPLHTLCGTQVGVKSPRDLKIWDGAAEALLDGLKSHMPSANGESKVLSWPATQSASSSSSSVEESSHHIFDITAVQTMVELNRQFLSMYTWPEEFKIASEDAEDDEASEEGEREESKDEEEGEWLTDNEFIGSRVCILCDEQGIHMIRIYCYCSVSVLYRSCKCTFLVILIMKTWFLY